MIVVPSGCVSSNGYGVAGTAQRVSDAMQHRIEDNIFFIFISPYYAFYIKIAAKIVIFFGLCKKKRKRGKVKEKSSIKVLQR